MAAPSSPVYPVRESPAALGSTDWQRLLELLPGDLETSAWAAVAGVADLSDVALGKRLRQSQAWLGALVAAGSVGGRSLTGPSGRTSIDQGKPVREG